MITFLSYFFVVGLTAASSLTFPGEGVGIPASSRLGSRLLSTARRLNNDNNDDGVDYTWISGYSIRFDSCHTTLQFRADGGGSGDDQDGAPTENMRLVHFKLCPSDKCQSSCSNGADYLVEMQEFVEAYLEYQMTQKEYNCEKVKDNCSCDDDDQVNDEYLCLQQCYQAAGLDYCEDENDNNNNNNNNNDFDIEEYLECERLNEDDGSSSAIYVGAYCSTNGKSIYLGTFTDRQCSTHSSADTYKSYTGYDLPYTSQSLVSSDCLACQEPSEYDDDNYNNADQNDEDQVVEICENLYQRAAKCERNLKDDAVTTKAVGGCDYLFKTLVQAERLATGGSSAAIIFAWMFAVTTLLLSCYSYYLYKRLTRNKVNLSTQSI